MKKNICSAVSAVLAVVMLIAAGAFAAAAVTGDFTGDGKVSSDDAVYLLRYTLFPERFPIEADGDFTGDGRVSSDDAVYLLRYTLFPDRFPIESGATVGLTYTVNGDGKTCTVTGKKDSAAFGDIVIPSMIDGYTVTAIGDSAFAREYAMKSLSLPDSLKTVGDSAFFACSALTAVTIPDGVTAIAGDAFNACSALETVQFGDGVESIGARAFYGCSSLTEIVLPRKLTTVENYAFFGCAALNSVTLRAGIAQIKAHAFEGCAALGTIYFPGSRDEWLGISKAADWDKDSGDYSVCCTDGDIRTYSDGLIYKDAEGGSAWRVTDIGTFAGEALIIPAFYEGRPVVEISRQAFAGCEDLTSVTIPKSVKVIDDSAFEDCGAIKKVYYKGELSDWYAISFGGAESNPLHSGADLFVNGAAVTMLIVPKAVEAIGDGQFAGCVTIEEVNMGSGVTRIGNEAFGGCKNITAVSLSSSTLLEEIDDYAFEGCEKLVKLDIPNSVTKIGRYFCKGCEALYQVKLGTGVTAIPASAFEGCMSLKTVRINGKITSIGAKAFAGCISLETITFSGTKAEWEALTKGSGWASATPNFAVTCSDGTIYPNG